MFCFLSLSTRAMSKNCTFEDHSWDWSGLWFNTSACFNMSSYERPYGYMLCVSVIQSLCLTFSIHLLCCPYHFNLNGGCGSYMVCLCLTAGRILCGYIWCGQTSTRGLLAQLGSDFQNALNELKIKRNNLDNNVSGLKLLKDRRYGIQGHRSTLGQILKMIHSSSKFK